MEKCKSKKNNQKIILVVMIKFQHVVKKNILKEFQNENMHILEKIDSFSFIPSKYLQWLKNQCAKVIPVDSSMDIDKMYKYMKFVDGVLLIGGDVNLTKDKIYTDKSLEEVV